MCVCVCVCMYVCMYHTNHNFLSQFEKPGRRENFDYPDMGREAVTKALDDCKLPYSAVQQATVGFVYGKIC